MNCPSCNPENIAGILYGLPSDDKELEQEIERGEVTLGGCCVLEGSPTHHCNECNVRWGNFDKTTYIRYTEVDQNDEMYKLFKL